MPLTEAAGSFSELEDRLTSSALSALPPDLKRRWRSAVATPDALVPLLQRRGYTVTPELGFLNLSFAGGWTGRLELRDPLEAAQRIVVGRDALGIVTVLEEQAAVVGAVHQQVIGEAIYEAGTHELLPSTMPLLYPLARVPEVIYVEGKRRWFPAKDVALVIAGLEGAATSLRAQA